MFKYFVINFILSLIIYGFLRKRRVMDAAVGFFLMLLLPIVGHALYITLIYCRKYFIDTSREMKLRNSEDNTEYLSLLLRKAGSKVGASIIPIEDALVLNDEKVKRKLIIDALKGDAYQYLGFLKKALKDEDTETSHYAATAVMEIKRKLTVSILEMENKYEKDKRDINTLNAYTEVLKRYMESGLLDSKSYLRYMEKYQGLLENILDLQAGEEVHYEEIIKCNIFFKKYDRAMDYCKEYMKYFAFSDEPYVLLMNIHFLKKDKQSFMEVFNQLRSSSVVLRGTSLKIVRYWMEAV